MSELIFDVRILIAAVLLLGWLAVRLLTEYLFQIEHKPRTWVHRTCFVVYRRACWLSRSLNRWSVPAWLVELPYTLLPLPLCRIGYEIWSSDHAQDHAQDLEQCLRGGAE